MEYVGVCSSALKDSFVERFSDLVDGVELVFKDSSELDDFELSTREIDFLEKLNFVSIHAPWSEDKLSTECLEKLGEVIDLIKVCNVVVHPMD